MFVSYGMNGINDIHVIMSADKERERETRRKE